VNVAGYTVSVGTLLAVIALIILVALLVTGGIEFLWVGLILLLLALSRLI
jgi:hypothetical protein